MKAQRSPSAHRFVNRHRRATLVLLALAAACADGVAPVVPASLSVQPKPVRIDAIGSEMRLNATARDGAGREIPSPTVTWVTSDPTVATVDGNGTVTSRGEGDAIVKVSYNNAVSDSTVVEVRATILFSVILESAQNGVVDSAKAAAAGSVMVHAKSP